jgi:hypothetical protein
LFLGFFLLLIAPEILLGKQKPKIKWIPEKVSVNFEEGEEIVYEVYFESDKEAKNVELWMTPSLSQILKVEPLQFNEIKANEKNAVKLRFSGSAGKYEGTLHVKSEGFNLANPLSVEVKITKKEGSVEADEEDLCASGKIASDFSEDWKRWKEYPYKPSLEDMKKIAGESPVVFVFEFKSIWDPVFKDHPKSPDGFLIFHIAFLLFDAKEVFIKVEVPDGVRVIGGNEFRIGEVSKNDVKSFYVPIKMCGNYGTFPIRARLEYQSVHGNFSFSRLREKTIFFILREHRRDIKAFDPAEYSMYLLEKRLEKYEKREGAAYYPPIAYADDPFTLGEVKLEFEADPLITVDPNIPVDADLEEFFDVPPFVPTDVDIEFEPTDSESGNVMGAGRFSRVEPKSIFNKVCYAFEGQIIFRENYSGRDVPLAGASVNAYDYDPTSPHDFICSARTDSQGKFKCSGCAEDDIFAGNPDPYIIVFASNGSVHVKNIKGKEYSQRLKSWDGLSGGSYNIGLVRVGSEKDMNDMTLRAFWVFRFARTAWIKNAASIAGDIGQYEIIFPYSEKDKNFSFYSPYDSKIYILFEEAEASIVAHEFGHALMHRLQLFLPFSLLTGKVVESHDLCSNDLPPTDVDARKVFAFQEGFANAVALVSFNTPLFCWKGLPWELNAINPNEVCRNLEGSTVRKEDDNLQNRWEKHVCPYCEFAGEYCFPPDQNEGYVTSAIFDLWDNKTTWGTHKDDLDCEFHKNAGRRACDSAGFGWGAVLNALRFGPKNYIDFISKLESLWGCEARNMIRETSRFNGIFVGDYISCPQPEPPSGSGGGSSGGGSTGSGGGSSSGSSGGGGGCSSMSPIPVITSFMLILLIVLKRTIFRRGKNL